MSLDGLEERRMENAHFKSVLKQNFFLYELNYSMHRFCSGEWQRAVFLYFYCFLFSEGHCIESCLFYLFVFCYLKID